MLVEMRSVRQVPEEGFRRWFCDEDLDLMVWYKPDKRVHGFQLCYDKSGQEKALTWFEDRGFSHQGVDSGDETPLSNRSPMLIEAARFETDRVFSCLSASDKELPPKLRALIRRMLKEYGRSLDAPPA